MKGTLSTIVSLIEKNCPLHVIQELSRLDNKFATESILEKCMQTVHVVIVETDASNFCSNSLLSLISKMWYLQMVGSSSCLRGGQYSILYSYCFFHMCLQKKRLFFEQFVWKLGITCNITTAIWLLSRFLIKTIWKIKYCYFSYKPTKKQRDSIYGNVTWQWPKKRKKLLNGKCHVTMREAFRSNSF